MNLEVISYFNVALSNTEGDAKALSFEEVNAEAQKAKEMKVAATV